MKPLLKLLGSTIAISAALLGASAPGRAQSYPSRAVQLVVGYAQGGTGDIIARAIVTSWRRLLVSRLRSRTVPARAAPSRRRVSRERRLTDTRS